MNTQLPPQRGQQIIVIAVDSPKTNISRNTNKFTQHQSDMGVCCSAFEYLNMATITLLPRQSTRSALRIRIPIRIRISHVLT